MVVLLAAISLACLAQTPASRFISAVGSNKLEFNYKISEGVFRGDGKIVLQGTSFRMKGNGLEVVSDGKSIWTVDEKAREVVVEAVVKTVWKTIGPNVVELAPENEASFKTLTLTVSDARRPEVTSVLIELPDESKLKVAVSDVKYLPKSKNDIFVLKTDTLAVDYVVTDLR